MLVALLATAAISQSEPPWLPETFSLLCEATSSTGFAFENGGYVRSTFTPQRTLVSRSPELECFGDERVSAPVVEILRFRKVCIAQRNLGEPMPRHGTLCEEMQLKGDDDVWTTQLRCESGANLSRYSLDGRYLRSGISGRLDQDRAERADIFVEHGVCSRVS